jgi:phthalate 4,5-dioxygenase
MLTAEENELLTRVGPGTRMGNLLRRYWVPALVAEELPEPGCPQVRVRLLGEDLVAVRASDGQLGILQEACAHRCASLYWGRLEEGGLRCAYHGWKYDLQGRCIEMPSEPPESRFKDKIRIAAYPAREHGGLIWAYMGPPEKMPPLPELEWCVVPPTHRRVFKRIQECNWVQILEGNSDPVHVSFLHQSTATEYLPSETLEDFATRQRLVDYEILPRPYGMLTGMKRPLSDGGYMWKTSHWIMPWHGLNVQIPGLPFSGIFYTPIDDATSYMWIASYRVERPLDDREIQLVGSGIGLVTPAIPGTFRNASNRENDYLIDRRLQKQGYMMPVQGIGVQDLAIQESQGAVFDRTREHLGTSDTLIIQKRRALLDAMAAVERGEDPPGLDPSTHHVRSASHRATSDASFEEAVRDAVTSDAPFYAQARS